jgi:hypothetical protein
VEAPGGVEPPTNGLGNRCSIHLSYGANVPHNGIMANYRMGYERANAQPLLLQAYLRICVMTRYKVDLPN